MADLFALTQQALVSMEDIELIDVERAHQGLLRVTIDRSEGVRLEDCEQVSHQLSHVYEVENVEYARLEVTSPGLDRPLRREVDFYRWVGYPVVVKLRHAVNVDGSGRGRKVFTGILVDALKNGDKEERQEVMQRHEREQAVFGVQFEAKKDEIQVVNFILEEVEYAKLDPVLDFKGKKR